MGGSESWFLTLNAECRGKDSARINELSTRSGSSKGRREQQFNNRGVSMGDGNTKKPGIIGSNL